MVYQIDTVEIENNLLECRRLLTTSVTDLSEFSTMEKIKSNSPMFVRKCHEAYKQAQDILLRQNLKLEEIIKTLNDRKDSTLKDRISQLCYWKLLLELAFNTFVWIAMRWDRSSVRKVFKGPKYGSLSHQSIDIVLPFVSQANKEPNDFMVLLDFCTFCCVSDLLRISFEETNGTFKLDFIEAKSGKVNEEIMEIIESNQESLYFSFFDKYGRKGIKQMERCFKQEDTLVKNMRLMHADPGIYQHPADENKKLIISENRIAQESYIDNVVHLLDESNHSRYAVDLIDECLVVGVINTEDRKQAIAADFDIRLFIYHIYINPAALDKPPDPDELVSVMKEIELRDWREGFSSVILHPILVRQIPEKHLMDLLMGRKKLMYFFNAERFIGLCRRNGVNASFTSKKQSNRMKSQGQAKGLVEFEGNFIRIMQQKVEWILGEGEYGEMIYNWIRPVSIIAQMESFQAPV